MEEEASRFDDHVFMPMVSLEMNVSVFKSQWQFCDEITEYLSDILGQGHSDPARYANFLSVAANELIELAFRATNGRGKISFSLARSATYNRLRVAFPCDEKFRRKYMEAGSGEIQPADGALLSNLATIFGAAIHIEKDGDGADRIGIIADFPSAEDFQ